MRRPRYTTTVVARARELHEAGWSLREIRRLLERELKASPAPDTIRMWVNPEVPAALRIAGHRRRNRNRLATEPPAPRRVSPERMLVRMRELRARGLSFRAIGQVTAVWFGEELSCGEVESRLAGKRTYARAEA